MIADRNVTSTPTRRQQVIGVILVTTVAIIWVVSAEFIQFIFGSSKYDKPYFLSYICVSMFSIFLLGFFRSSWRAKFTNLYYGLNDEEIVPSDPHRPLTSLAIVRVAVLLSPLFFLCNWTFNLGLAYTSVASSSIIATLTSLFTLGIGAFSGVERFSLVKLLAAFLSIAGVAVIFAVDDSAQTKIGSNPSLGDAVSVVSAFIYAVYTVLLKSRAPTEASVDISMLLAFIGTFTALSTWPGILLLDLTNLEPFEWPSLKTSMLLVVNALIGTVLSDFLWALSIVLTTPLLTTLSLSLTVPLSIILDVLWKHKPFSLGYFFGAALVFVGFFLVNVDIAFIRASQNEQRTEEEALDG